MNGKDGSFLFVCTFNSANRNALGKESTIVIRKVVATKNSGC